MSTTACPLVEHHIGGSFDKSVGQVSTARLKIAYAPVIIKSICVLTRKLLQSYADSTVLLWLGTITFFSDFGPSVYGRGR